MKNLFITINETGAETKLHYIDRKGYYNEAFTPYAAMDPESGVAYSHWNEAELIWEKTDSETYFFNQSLSENPHEFARHYRRSVGTIEDQTAHSPRKLSLIKLLQRIFEGIETSTETYEGLYRGVQGGFDSISFHLPTLRSVSITNRGREIDFSQRLLLAYRLESREIAWRISWALVRASWLERWDIADLLIQTINEGRDGANSKSKAKNIRKVIEEGIAILKCEVLK